MSSLSLRPEVWLLAALGVVAVVVWLVTGLRGAARVIDEMPVVPGPRATLGGVRGGRVAAHALELARRGEGEALIAFLQHEAHPDVSDEDGQTPLMVAAGYGHPEVVRRLVHLGADVNRLDRQGMSALGRATLAEHCDVCHQLIDLGADVDHGHPTARQLAERLGRPDLLTA